MRHPLSGVEVSRHSKPLFSATALLAVVEFCRAFRARLLPAGSKTRRSAGGRRQCCFGTHQRQRRWGCSVSQLPQRRSMSGMRRRAGQRFSLAVRHRFFWQDKRNGVGKNTVSKVWPLDLGTFCTSRKYPAGGPGGPQRVARAPPLQMPPFCNQFVVDRCNPSFYTEIEIR